LSPLCFEVSLDSLTSLGYVGFFSSVMVFSGIEPALIPISFSSTSSFVVTILKSESSYFLTSYFGFGFSICLSTSFGFSYNISFLGSTYAT
jgi:hypothetical protein